MFRDLPPGLVVAASAVLLVGLVAVIVIACRELLELLERVRARVKALEAPEADDARFRDELYAGLLVAVVKHEGVGALLPMGGKTARSAWNAATAAMQRRREALDVERIGVHVEGALVVHGPPGPPPFVRDGVAELVAGARPVGVNAAAEGASTRPESSPKAP